MSTICTICTICKYRLCVCAPREQRKQNFEVAQMAENQAMGVQSFTPTPGHYENGGEDIIDRTFRTGTTEEIRGVMKFNITKYADRLGKKDSEIDELTKIINYTTRYRNHLINKGNKS